MKRLHARLPVRPAPSSGPHDGPLKFSRKDADATARTGQTPPSSPRSTRRSVGGRRGPRSRTKTHDQEQIRGLNGGADDTCKVLIPLATKPGSRVAVPGAGARAAGIPRSATPATSARARARRHRRTTAHGRCTICGTRARRETRAVCGAGRDLPPEAARRGAQTRRRATSRRCLMTWVWGCASAAFSRRAVIRQASGRPTSGGRGVATIRDEWWRRPHLVVLGQPPTRPGSPARTSRPASSRGAHAPSLAPSARARVADARVRAPRWARRAGRVSTAARRVSRHCSRRPLPTRRALHDARAINRSPRPARGVCDATPSERRRTASPSRPSGRRSTAHLRPRARRRPRPRRRDGRGGRDASRRADRARRR